MTFCLGMKCAEGLLALADTRITSGTETSTAKKIWVHQDERASLFVLTSGLRSVRDKAMTYFRERLEDQPLDLRRLHHAANMLAEDIRRTRSEDQRWLEAEGLHFDLHCTFGGQIAGENSHRFFLIYPEGNWIEVGEKTPFVIIGESRYGKPVLNRIWRHDAPLQQGLRDALLAFDATRTSAADVGSPLDAVLYAANAFDTSEHRFERADLEPVAEYWGARHPRSRRRRRPHGRAAVRPPACRSAARGPRRRLTAPNSASAIPPRRRQREDHRPPPEPHNLAEDEPRPRREPRHQPVHHRRHGADGHRSTQRGQELFQLVGHPWHRTQHRRARRRGARRKAVDTPNCD